LSNELNKEILVMSGIERVFYSDEMFKALVLVPIAEGASLTDEAGKLLEAPELQTFLRSTWARERLYVGWDDTARLGLWVAWLIRLLLERHIASGQFTDEALTGLLLAYGLYGGRVSAYQPGSGRAAHLEGTGRSVSEPSVDPSYPGCHGPGLADEFTDASGVVDPR
jgi:hypothetical protein